MKTNETITRTLEDVLMESVFDGTFFKYLMLEAEANARTNNKFNNSVKTYLIRDKKTLLIKIGKAKDIKKRLSMLSCGNPNLELVAVCDSDVEGLLHSRFSKQRIKGEWFALSKKSVNAIIREYGFKKANTPKVFEP